MNKAPISSRRRKPLIQTALGNERLGRYRKVKQDRRRKNKAARAARRKNR